MNARRATVGLAIAICAVVMATCTAAIGEVDELAGLKKAKVEAARKYLAGLEDAIKAPPAGDRPRLNEIIADLADWSNRSMDSQLVTVHGGSLWHWWL